MQKNSGSLKKTETGGDVGEDESNALIPLADVAAITGTAFTNYTIEHLLGPCNRDAYVLILGNTTPLSPVLFDYGLDAISGARVIIPQQALSSCISQGANFRQIKGIKRLTILK